MSKEAISKIREKLGKDSSKVETLLVEIEGDYKEAKTIEKDLRDDLNHANTESKGRKLDLRKITSELEDANENIETLKGQDSSEELETLQKKVKGYEDVEAEKVKTKAKGFIDKYPKLKDHVDWEACKGKFKIPEEKDGKMDWDSIDVNDIAKNADGLTEYIGIGKLGKADPNSEQRSQSRSSDADENNPYKGKFN